LAAGLGPTGIVAATRLLEKLRLRLDKELKDEAGEYD
jgi:hypothetical protein